MFSTHKYTDINVGPIKIPDAAYFMKQKLGPKTYRLVIEGEDVAIKCYGKLPHTSYYSDNAFDAEYQKVKYLSHPNLVNILGYVEYSNIPKWNRAAVVEFMHHGTLGCLIAKTKYKNDTLTWADTYQMAGDIAQGLAYLHANSIVYVHLNPHSVFLDEYNGHSIAKIGDYVFHKFSLSHEHDMPWRHPYTFQRHFSSNKKNISLNATLDVYSFGLILWSMHTLEVPFASISNSHLVSHIMEGNTVAIPPDLPPSYLALLTQCLRLPKDINESSTPQWIHSVPTAMNLSWQTHELRQSASRPAVQNAFNPLTPLENDYEEQISKHIKSAGHSLPLNTYKEPINTSFTLRQDTSVATRGENGPRVTLQDADTRTWEMIAKSYLQCPVPGYELGRVRVIYNRDTALRFNNTLDILEHRSNDARFFAPQWLSENDADQRHTVDDYFHTMNRDYFDAKYPHVRAIGVWHGTTSEANVSSIAANGLGIIQPKHGDLFGQGVYGTVEAKYAREVYQKGQPVPLMFFIMAFQLPYPVIPGDMSKLSNHANYQNYDGHVIPVAPDFPGAENAMYIPSTLQDHTYLEVCAFDLAAVLPYAMVDLVKISPGQDNRLPVVSPHSITAVGLFNQNKRDPWKEAVNTLEMNKTPYVIMDDGKTIIHSDPTGKLTAFNPYTKQHAMWQAHAGQILELMTEKNDQDALVIVTAGEDGVVKTWMFDCATFQYNEYKNEAEPFPRYTIL